MYFDLLPFAKECGVKIATENMWGWDKEKDQSSFAACATSASFNEHLDIVNDDFFVACLDIGHAEMRGSGEGATNMIRALETVCRQLHIHDNDCWHDSHQIPFSMSIDFDAVVKALKDINYSVTLHWKRAATSKHLHQKRPKRALRPRGIRKKTFRYV